MTDPRPAELRLFKSLQIEAHAGAIPPNELDSVGSFRAEDVKRTVERLRAGIRHRRKEAIDALSTGWLAR
nr:hypothetical protein [Mesorhizobium amorphae]